MSRYDDFADINKFISNSFVTKSSIGLLRSNRFAVYINRPNSGVKDPEDDLRDLERTLMFNAISCSCSNIAIETGGMEINSRQKWYYKNRSDGDLSITFLETPDLRLRRYFLSWIKQGFDITTVTRNYLDTVVCNEILITPLDNNGETSYGDKFWYVFPYDINALEYNISDENNLLKTDVKFKFQYHDIVKTP